MRSAPVRAPGVVASAEQRELPLFDQLAAAKRAQRTLDLLKSHRGQANAIGMGELFSAVFQAGFRNRINDTRGIRTIIEALRGAGHPICSNQDGYYLPANAAELLDYRNRRRQRKLREFIRDARTCGATLPELQGQLAMEWGETG